MSCMPRRKGQAGFTAIELMVVLVIFGVVLAAGVPAFQTSLTNHRLQAAADQIRADMRLTRARAVAENTPYILVWYAADEKYFVVRDDNRDGEPDWGSEPTSGPFELPKSIDLSNDTEQPFPSTRIVFFPNGSTNASGRLSIEDAKGRQLLVELLQPNGVANVVKP